MLAVFIAVVLTMGWVGAKTPGAPMSRGEPWPMPASYTPGTVQLALNQANFQFKVTGQDCDILRAAITRYYRLIFQVDHGYGSTSLRFQRGLQADSWDTVTINVKNKCEDYPYMNMDESYTLNIGHYGSDDDLMSDSVWGALRGLETFSQLVYRTDDGQFVINSTSIKDAPRFSHRGVLLDTSRHFVHKDIIIKHLEAMEYNKLNVFHWHIVDDESFPYQSRDFPDLSYKGAYSPMHVYTQQDVAEIVGFARVRGIRVVPEFDTPGHTQSWGDGQPDLLTKCYHGNVPSGSFGPIDPTLNTSYTFLKAFMKELTQVFPDKYMHLGGDEVSFDCWKSNPQIGSFMKKMGYGTDYSKLEQYYEQKLLDIVNELDHDYIVWQEIADNGVTVRPDTVIHVWKSGTQWQKEMASVTKAGKTALLSSCWYLNHFSFGADWIPYYGCDPHDFNGTEAQKKLVMGGEFAMWGEYVDSHNLISRTWPRGSAVAERLWSPADVTDSHKAVPRIEEHRCRMIRRGIQAEPINGPGYCPIW